MEEVNKEEPNFDMQVPAVKSETNNEINLWKGDEVNKFLKSLGVRENNTIPKQVELIIIFKDKGFKPQKYKYNTENGTGERAAFVINAIIKYNEEASHLVLGMVYPLALSKNGFMGLANLINATGGDFNLSDRTFTVINANGHTYIWKEISEQENLVN